MKKDAYEFYRVEARELLEGLGQAVLALERGSENADVLAKLLRLAHTLKGASRVVKQIEIADCAHELEDLFAPHREMPDAIPSTQIDRALCLLDAATMRVAALDRPEEAPPEAPSRTIAAGPEPLDTVRVEIKELDGLLHALADVSARVAAFTNEIENLDRAHDLSESVVQRIAFPGSRPGRVQRAANKDALRVAEELRATLDPAQRALKLKSEQAAGELANLRDRVNDLRLVPSSSLFSALERAVRDAAHTLQKEVAFETSGGDARLDAHVLAILRDALLHVVRNGVAHGIESAAERAAAGKPAAGKIDLIVERRGNRIAFVCRDDGRGIDVDAIRRAAIRRGLIPAAEAESLRLEDAVRIMMKSGVTTAGTVNEVSGRGIGLDVVRDAVERLRGSVDVKSEPGHGASIEICTPVSLSSLPALEVAAEETVAAVPLFAVRTTLRVSERDLVHSEGKTSVIYEGQAIPFLPLREILLSAHAHPSNSQMVDASLSTRTQRTWSAIILEQNSRVAAIGVDRLLGATTAVVARLPSLAATEDFVSGVSRNPQGDLQLLLDAEALISKAALEKPAIARAATRRLSVLVTDDSLTTRMLEQSILESAGHQVELATSAEEGLQKARANSYDVFLVDVEMPGMNGFEFVAHTQADARLRHVPAILVTSCNSPEDRLRAEQAGARGYVVKGEFDQTHLLRLIRELAGE